MSAGPEPLPDGMRRGLSGVAAARDEGGCGMIEAAMIWNEPNNKSHWDPELDPDWSRFARMCRLAGEAIAAEAPGLPRVLGGISPIDPNFIANMAGTGRARRARCHRGARLSARLESVADRRLAGKARGDRRRHRPAGLGVGMRRVELRRRGGAGVRAAGAPPNC